MCETDAKPGKKSGPARKGVRAPSRLGNVPKAGENHSGPFSYIAKPGPALAASALVGTSQEAPDLGAPTSSSPDKRCRGTPATRRREGHKEGHARVFRRLPHLGPHPRIETGKPGTERLCRTPWRYLAGHSVIIIRRASSADLSAIIDCVEAALEATYGGL